jgi:hypothetical protein
MVFDAVVHESLIKGEPALYVYDTAFDGIANVNDRARDIDRMDLCEQIQPLGKGIEKFRIAEAPWYSDLLAQVCQKLGWNGDALRGYRSRIDYPLYGSQVAIAFPAEER